MRLVLLFLLLCTTAHAQLSSITTYVNTQLPNNSTRSIAPVNVRNAILSVANNLSTISYTGPISTSIITATQINAGTVSATILSGTFVYSNQLSATSAYIAGNISASTFNGGTPLTTPTTLISASFLYGGQISGSGAGLYNLPTFESVTASVGTDQNNYTISGMSGATQVESEFRVVPTASVILSGISSTGISTGKLLTIYNSTTTTGADGRLVILENNSPKSVAASRFNYSQMAMPLMLMPQDSVTFRYTGTKWNFLYGNRHASPAQFFDDFSDFINYFPNCWASGTGSTCNTANSDSGGVSSTQVGIGFAFADPGTTSTGRSYIGSAPRDFTLGYGALLSLVRVNPEQLSTAAQTFVANVGFSNASAAATISNTVGWAYDPSASASFWRSQAFNLGTSTSNTTAAPVSTTQPVKLLTFVNGTATNADYAWAVSDTWTFETPITTNLPAGNGATLGVQNGVTKKAGGSRVFVDFDYVGYRYEAPRGQ
jgi:hypothetical protein